MTASVILTASTQLLCGNWLTMTGLDSLNPRNQIYGFAFKGNISASTLSLLKNIDCCYQLSGKRSIDGYIENFLMREQPGHIVGLGMYSRVVQDKIRIETECTNQFRNGFLDGGTTRITLPLQPFLKPGSTSKFARGIGTSYCSMASWKIMTKIQSGELSAQYTFLHIPKTMPVWVAVKEIDELLKVYRSQLQD